MKKILCFLLIILSLFGFTGCVSRSEYFVIGNLDIKNRAVCRVVLLYGQSNASGFTSNEYLDKDLLNNSNLQFGFNNVYINYICEGGGNSSNNRFIKCKLGCGCGSSYFGPEVGIASVYSKKYPNENIFIIKSTWGGTDLNSLWLDGNGGRGDLYNTALEFTKQSLLYLMKNFKKVNIEGVCWMQGESDSTTYEEAIKYENNTKAFISYLRQDLNKKDLKFVDASINDNCYVWVYRNIINTAKQNVAALNVNNIYLDTVALGLTTSNEPYGQPDIAHYDAESMIRLGEAFAQNLIG